MEKENVRCHGNCKMCSICKNLKEEYHKRDEIARAFMSEDFSNIFCTNHIFELTTAVELISRLGEFNMPHRMADHLYRYIGSAVYSNDYMKDCINNVAKEDEKSDKKRLSDEFLIKTHDLYFTGTGAEEDEFKLYYKYLDQALEYIKSIGGFPDNMVTGGDYTPAYNRAANIINECILNKEHDVKLLDAIKADDEDVECSQEERSDKDAIDFLDSVKEIEYIKYDQYNFDIVNKYEKAANNAIKYLQSEGILGIQITGSAIKREARIVALKIIDTCICSGNYEFIAIDPTQKDDDEDDDIIEKAEIVKISSTIRSPKDKKFSYIIDDRILKATSPFAYEIFEKMMKSYYLTNTIYADELENFIDAMKGYINDTSINKLDSDIRYIHFLPSKDDVIFQFYCDEINDYISIIINLFIPTNPYKE